MVLPRKSKSNRADAVVRRAGMAVAIEGLETRQFLSITPVVTESGQVSLTVDGVGTSTTTGTVSTVKPAGATVRGAYLFAATAPSGNTLATGDITVDGKAVTFSQSVNRTAGITVTNYFGDVTSLVKAKIDGAAAGNIDLTIGEKTPGNSDGEILAVVYNDPSQTTNNTVVLLFGSQTSTGDTFNIGLANPINTALNKSLDLSLGISFGYQLNGGSQYSTVDVNGTRLTSSAGGDDDAANPSVTLNSLLTVGGIGDSDANPANPNALPDSITGNRGDDELYNLAPFVKNGDTQITVATKNPSNDDNIFFAALNLKGTTAVVGEGIVLAPADQSVPDDEAAVLTATVQDTNGKPLVGRPVTFTVTAGPDVGATFTANTDATGKAVYSLKSLHGDGTDTITATFTKSDATKSTSNAATVTFTGVTPVPTNFVKVDAGPDKAITLGASVTLTGSASDFLGPLPDSGLTWVVKNSANVTVATGSGKTITFKPTAAGTYTATLTATNGPAPAGDTESDSAIITVNPVVVPPPPTTGPTVTSYTLVDATTKKDVETIGEGTVLNLALLPKNLNIRANTSFAGAGKVQFGYDATAGKFVANYRLELGAPFALFGDFPGGNYFSQPLTLGTHTLAGTASLYTGNAGATNTIHFTVINGTPAASAISSFTLVDAPNKKDLLTITDGLVISLSSLGTSKLNIRANPTGSAVSVLFDYDGKTSVEQDAPFSLFGDFPVGSYYSGTLTLGTHTLTATPYGGKNATGAAGTAKTIKFTVVA